jgi:hypothetical protein
MKNMELWRSVCVTDPAAVKPITGKQYKGNSPKPYWVIQRATEQFGPCGIGWGIEVVNERFERFGDTEALHVALVRVWFVDQQGKRGQIEQMGQTRAAYMSAAGKYIVDEDAPKKSVTDGMVKCLSMLGFAGDIFSGQWDDSKYVEWAAAETARRETPTLNDEQVSEITGLLGDRDFAAFMKWVSKCAGQELQALRDVPAAAYTPIIKKLTEKAKA